MGARRHIGALASVLIVVVGVFVGLKILEWFTQPPSSVDVRSTEVVEGLRGPITTAQSPTPLATGPHSGSTRTAAPGTHVAGRTPVPAAPALRPQPVPVFPYRLTNSARSLEELARSDSAILLENALIDTAADTPPALPEHLRHAAPAGSYLVQSRLPLNAAFYQLLRESGAEFVAYVPNNAALVRTDPVGVERLAAASGVRAVLPYEPYYKIAQDLLPLAVEQEPLPIGQALNLILFPGERERVETALRALGAEVTAEDRTPFGPLVTVAPPADSLAFLARLAGVQRIEPAAERVLLNDLARVRVAVSTNGADRTNYLELTGTNIIVNLNDTGVDARHPDLGERVQSTDTNSFVLLDLSGHGTHVAGTLIGSGEVSDTVSNAPPGSGTNASFSGVAPGAELFVLPIDLDTGPLISNAYLQETAGTNQYVTRRRINPFVSNNSWAYRGRFAYDSAAASYDAAVRDTLPEMSGAQSAIYVFGAGNAGRSLSDAGKGGVPDSILSPATAKNVITVGALEQFRLITNDIIFTNLDGTTVTNQEFSVQTDSDSEVAAFSSRGNVGIGTEGYFGRFKPDVVAPGTFVVSARSQYWHLEDYIPVSSPYYPVLSNLNSQLEPSYRYESGTSMAAPVVSGVLALMQEFFERRLQQFYSPALLKALLINGARNVNSIYDFSATNVINYQGWGVVTLTNSLPSALTNVTQSEQWPLRFVDSWGRKAIATGQTHNWELRLATNGLDQALRVTLVWTDPPGNPGAAIKLVNDLDLVVTNLDTGEIYVGNAIPDAESYNEAIDTNLPAPFDLVNNVECVYLKPDIGTNYSISVIGHRVNVNAPTANTNDVVQDYALVVSSGNGRRTNTFETFRRLEDSTQLSPVVALTNGAPQLFQRVGANFQLLSSTNGNVNQWRFYIFTNAYFTNASVLTNGSNVAFITFLPPNLARPRNLEADIDLYVSKDANLTNLDPAVVAGAFQSTARGGTELVAFTNAVVGTNEIYYIGVKSEDQQACEFGIVALSTDLPFSSLDENGNYVLQGLPTNASVPDGSPNNPAAAYVFAVGLESVEIARVTAELTVTHQSVGDLLGNLSHQDAYAVLNNHSRFEGGTNLVHSVTYDDSGGGFYAYSRPSDGPGSLNDFIGMQGSGVWLFTMTDDALNYTGQVNNVIVRLQPNRLADGVVIEGSVLANQWAYYSIEVPADATELLVELFDMRPPLPLDLYVRRGDLPTFTDYDKKALIAPPGGELSLTRADVPPLNAGRYFIGIYNPNSVTVDFKLRVSIKRDLDAMNLLNVVSADTPLNLRDDAITSSTLFVPSARPVVDVQVGLVVDHARASDVVFHLVSPQGTRVLLAENRGRSSGDGYGALIVTTNVVPRTSRGGPEEDRNVIETGQRSGIVRLRYDFFQVPDTIRVYYEGVLLYDSGFVSWARTVSIPYGPGESTQVTIVVNEGRNPLDLTAWTYTASVVTERTIYTTFTESTNLASLPVKFADPPFTNSPVSSALTNSAIFQDSFEAYAPGAYAAVTNLGQWLIPLGQALVRGPGNPLGGVTANTGTNYVELAVSNQPSALTLAVDTTINRRYQLRFTTRRNPLGNPGTPQVLAVYTNGALADFLPVTEDRWVTNAPSYFATGPTLTFELRSASPVGPLIDSVRVLEVADEEEYYYFPEDFLSAFEGESAFGDWTLEMWDNRAGVGDWPAAQLLSWELRLVLANTNPPAIPLVFCRPDTNTASVYSTNCEPTLLTVTRDEIKYFIVEVPRVATFATNLVESTNDLVLLFNQDGLPSGQLPGDVVTDNFGAGGEILILNTNDPPQLKAGQRYYLGVANANPTETNTFFISVAFDQTDSYLVNVLELTNAIPYTATIPRTNALDYYQFTVSTNATEVRFELFPQNGNVDLVIRKAQPVLDPLPTTTLGHFDYLSRNPGTNAEQIIVTRISEPVPLEPGRWYLGVINVDTNPVNYTILVTETTGSLSNVITLSNAVPVDFTIPAGSAVTNYFLFSILEATNPAVLFEVYNLTDTATLLADLNQPPTLAAFFNDLGQPGEPAQIVLRTNTGAPANLAGDWWLRVERSSPTDLSFTIRAVLSTNGILPSGVPFQTAVRPLDPPGTGFELDWNSVPGERYQILRSTDLFTWVPVTIVVASTSHSSFQDLTPPPSPYVFYQVRQIP